MPKKIVIHVRMVAMLALLSVVRKGPLGFETCDLRDDLFLEPYAHRDTRDIWLH